jgi:hypothetical protein
VNSFFANFCTDKDYSTGKCLDICASSRGTGGNAQVTPCTGNADSETWCCGTSADCCSSGVNVVRLAQVLGGALSSTSSSAASTLSSASSSAAVTAVSPTPTLDSSTIPSSFSASKKKDGINAGAIAGIVIGVIIASAIFVGTVFLLKRKSKSKTAQASELGATTPPQYYVAQYVAEKDASGIAELATPGNELAANELRGVVGGTWPHGKGAELEAIPVQRM